MFEQKQIAEGAVIIINARTGEEMFRTQEGGFHSLQLLSPYWRDAAYDQAQKLGWRRSWRGTWYVSKVEDGKVYLDI